MKEMNVSVTFECEISKAGLKVEWFKGDKKLRRDDRYDITVDGKVHRLIIDKVTEKDIAEYSATYQTLKTSAKLAFAGEFFDQIDT